MPTYLDYYAMSQAQAAVDQVDGGADALRKLENLCADLMICLRTCGFYMFFLQLYGARNADREIVRRLMEPWRRAMHDADLITDQLATPEDALRVCDGSNITRLLLIKEVTETFLAYTRYEAKAARAQLAQAPAGGGQHQ